MLSGGLLQAALCLTWSTLFNNLPQCRELGLLFAGAYFLNGFTSNVVLLPCLAADKRLRVFNQILLWLKPPN